MATNPKIDPNKKVDPAKDAPQTEGDVAADYKWSIAMLNSNPEVRKIFRQAITSGWSPARFTAELQDTDWFKEHAASWRTNELQRIVDPATWQAGRDARKAEVEDTARAMGANLTASQLRKVADNSMAFGWNPSQMRNALGGYISEINKGTLKGQYAGEAGKWHQQLVASAKANGYTIPKGKINGWLTEIVKGNSTVDEYSEMMRRQAAHNYPSYADELYAGSNLDDLVGNYRTKIANLLEIDPDRIGLDDKLLGKAMTYKDAKGKAVPMPIGDFEDKVRADTRWQYTDNAHEQIMGQTLNLGRMFGKTGVFILLLLASLVSLRGGGDADATLSSAVILAPVGVGHRPGMAVDAMGLHRLSDQPGSRAASGDVRGVGLGL